MRVARVMQIASQTESSSVTCRANRRIWQGFPVFRSSPVDNFVEKRRPIRGNARHAGIPSGFMYAGSNTKHIKINELYDPG
jgi:hypothetical protein